MKTNELKAGRELDALVAEKVMGLPVKWSTPPYVWPNEIPREGRFPYLKGKVNGCEYDWANVPHYSTDIAAAWQVVEEMVRWGWLVDIRRRRDHWQVEFFRHDDDPCLPIPGGCCDHADVKVAICAAALETMESPA